MSSIIKRIFQQHPATVGETYGQHFVVAMGFGLRLLGAGLAAMVHALVPCLFDTTARRTVYELNDLLSNRGAPEPTGHSRSALGVHTD